MSGGVIIKRRGIIRVVSKDFERLHNVYVILKTPGC